MSNFIVIATRDSGSSYWYADFISRRIIGNITFNVVENSFSSVEKLTLEGVNNNTQFKGVIMAENITGDIETLMRTLGFRKCAFCGSWVSPQEVRQGNDFNNRGYDSSNNPLTFYDRTLDQRYCKVCSAKKLGMRENDIYLSPNDYHSANDNCDYGLILAPNEVRNDTTEIYTLGIELEGSTTRDLSRGVLVNKKFEELYNSNKFFLEYDATVSFELISGIFTEQAMNCFDWKILTDVLEKNGCDDTRVRTGLHIHINKKVLGDTEKEQVINYLKLFYFINCYKNDFRKVSGRSDNSTDWGYCNMYTDNQIKDLKTRIESATRGYWNYIPNGDHSTALNTDDYTIEVRFGHSTNDPVRLKNYISLIYYIVKGLRGLRWDKVYCMRKAFRLVPNEVMNYWRSKGCFMTTNAKDIRGIEFTTQAQQ